MQILCSVIGHQDRNYADPAMHYAYCMRCGYLFGNPWETAYRFAKLYRYEHWTPDGSIEDFCDELTLKLANARQEISEARAALFQSPLNLQHGSLADNIRKLSQELPQVWIIKSDNEIQ